MLSNINKSRSMAVQSIEKFSAVEFIAPHHDAVDQEKNHALLRRVEYRNYFLDGRISRPLIWIGVKEMVAFINQILDSSAGKVKP